MNNGKKGEAKMAEILAKIAQKEEKVDFTKPTFTNAPDNGVDFEIRCPHNIVEKFTSIIDGKESDMALSNSTIDIRVDHKEYSKPIGKPTVEKFVKDISKNEKYAEHWLTGGDRLTAGGKKVLEEANKNSVVRYYSNDELNKINNFYDNELLNENESE